MVDKEKEATSSTYTLFPVKNADGAIHYYCSDYSQCLGRSVYKGYECILKQDDSTLIPRRVTIDEIIIDEHTPVAIKFYEPNQHPSAYQYYSSEIAVIHIEDKDVLIMEYQDGFHILPDAQDNPDLMELNFFEAVDIAWHLIIDLNNYHYTNSSGPAIVHGDIKGENVKIKLSKKEGEKRSVRVDTTFLDLDYAKPVLKTPQQVEGTPEHLALELLEGYYSEESDFFALCPILLSLFGARNPFSKIIEFRDSHMSMQSTELVRHYCELGFCSEGLFEHFEKKPERFICNVIERFIQQMGAKLIQHRPAPAAILEFFTALRQWCLIPDNHEDREICLLRLYISAKDDCWINQQKFLVLFSELATNLQERLMKLICINQCIPLYKALQSTQENTQLINHLRSKIAVYLAEYPLSSQQNFRMSSLFNVPLNTNDLQWLLYCYENKDYDEFFAAKNKKIRTKLMHCSEPTLASLIFILIDGLNQHTRQLATLA